MTEEEFLARIVAIDKELGREEIPVRARSLAAFHRLEPDFEGSLAGYGVGGEGSTDLSGAQLLARTVRWYRDNYDKRACMPAIGSVPVLIRGEVFLVRIPLVYGEEQVVNVLRFVQGMTSHMAVSLTQDEQDLLKRTFAEGFSLTYEIEDFNSIFLQKMPTTTARRILERAVEDRDDTMRCLGSSPDPPNTNGACFHAQQFSEKMLKGFLLAKKVHSEKQVRDIKHDLLKLFKACAATKGSFAELTSDIGLLSNIRMDVRYTADKMPLGVAVDAVWASLRVAGFVACQIAGNNRR